MSSRPAITLAVFELNKALKFSYGNGRGVFTKHTSAHTMHTLTLHALLLLRLTWRNLKGNTSVLALLTSYLAKRLVDMDLTQTITTVLHIE